MATRYLSVPTLKAWRRDGTKVSGTLTEESINAATQAIDNALHRRIEKATPGAEGLTTRVYAPGGSQRLWIDDCTEVVEVVENGVTLAAGVDYQLEPLNGLSSAGEPRPYDRLKRHGQCWYSDDDKATVSITARFGWAEIPPQVIEACKVIADEMCRNPELRFGLVAITDAGGFGARESRTVTKMINDYRSAYKQWGIA